MKFLLLASLAAFTSFSAFAADPVDDNKAVQGTWKPSAGEMGGQPLPAEALQSITLTIKDNTYQVTVTGEGPDKGTFVLNPAAKPKTLTIKSNEGANKGNT